MRFQKNREEGRNNGQKTPKFDEVIYKSDAQSRIIIKWSKPKSKREFKNNKIEATHHFKGLSVQLTADLLPEEKWKVEDSEIT